ncbi:hypothetical protein ADK96_27660 [Streptomyces sp. IGB124]|nr:hypothetical protein ADK96_27660 [Streptomyces sp. IGB124]
MAGLRPPVAAGPGLSPEGVTHEDRGHRQRGHHQHRGRRTHPAGVISAVAALYGTWRARR